MRNIRLNDGTTYQVTRCGALRSGKLFLGIVSQESWTVVAAKFSDPSKTSLMEHWYDGTDTDHLTYEGYIDLVQVVAVEGGYDLMLKKAGVI